MTSREQTLKQWPQSMQVVPSIAVRYCGIHLHLVTLTKALFIEKQLEVPPDTPAVEPFAYPA
ncbi:hypothetical protein X760_22200 [Mesorhizobium sp. LSHC422A00]|nr:hypothetical protein X762_28230 [Mesorhizobium sp. LSHC426A00]ESX47292.1 hypothetical protein X761_30160 [Mesorhizobium sp. LSHC424B00]ESX56978.1 hypothetical protein X760_22200 [Mesorhizobium sp. LSHC422A00]ESX65057.1 hypothetical protein X758_30795 [Mesorhizobium sp. LSHC416B00]